MTWKKGQSGNPGGRPAGYGDLRELARTHTEAAVQTFVEIMNDSSAASSARAAAATGLLDRGWGRPEASLRLESVEATYADVLRRINEEEDAAEVESLPEKVLLAPING